jgi:hypothetical protein
MHLIDTLHDSIKIHPEQVTPFLALDHISQMTISDIPSLSVDMGCNFTVGRVFSF